MPARRNKPSIANADPHLGEGQSAPLRDQLIAEIKRIGSADEAATWAQRQLGAKNTLMPADANAVETAFAQRLASLEESPINPSARCEPATGERRAPSHAPACRLDYAII